MYMETTYSDIKLYIYSSPNKHWIQIENSHNLAYLILAKIHLKLLNYDYVLLIHISLLTLFICCRFCILIRIDQAQ